MRYFRISVFCSQGFVWRRHFYFSAIFFTTTPQTRTQIEDLGLKFIDELFIFKHIEYTSQMCLQI